MATNYQALLDMLKPQEEEPMMSQMVPEQTASLQQAPEIPVEEITPVVTPQPAMRNIAAEQAPQMPETPMSRSEALLAEYQKMMGKDQEELKAARERDRMLKVGGALGDSLATIINARSQMNVKAPGVQVQQGAGLGEIANMFVTAPEIASDVAQRRQALMDQYKQLAIGESSAAKRELEKQRIQALEEKNRLYGKQVEKMGSGREEARSFKEEESKKRDDRFVKKEMLGLMDKVGKDFRYKDAYKESLSFDQVDKLMEAGEKGNQVAFNTIGTKMAKAMGEVGVLTESDVKRYVEGGSLTRKAGDSLLRMINGKPSQATIDDIKQITQVLREAHQSKLQPVFDDYANRAVQLGFSEEEAYKKFKFPLPPRLKQQTQGDKKEQQALDMNFEPRIEKVLKANPGSTRQQVIDALKKDEKLPADYE